jgi:hypothetical protein
MVALNLQGTMRTRRLQKKLHKQWLSEVAREIVMDQTLEPKLWNMEQGESMEFDRSSYCGSEFLNKFDLNITVVRGPIEGHWLYKEYDPCELNLFFYATQFPSLCHGWTLYE